MTFDVPHFTYKDVNEYAENFLKQYHPSLELPIPIEWIIENGLNIHIYPFPELYRIFGQSGFLSHDRKVIYIDEYQYNNFIEKYRFTLAHEVGHFILHESLYKDLSFNSVEEYIQFLKSIAQIYWFETHSDWFAGQVLVPTPKLEEHCIDLLENYRDLYSQHEYLPHEFWSYASNDLADIFEVNPVVIEIRIRLERLSDKYIEYYHK